MLLTFIAYVTRWVCVWAYTLQWPFWWWFYFFLSLLLFYFETNCAVACATVSIDIHTVLHYKIGWSCTILTNWKRLATVVAHLHVCPLNWYNAELFVCLWLLMLFCARNFKSTINNTALCSDTFYFILKRKERRSRKNNTVLTRTVSMM